MSSVVVGGGVAGLVAGRELARAGHTVTVLEAGEPGGSVASRHLDGVDLDVGAEGFATRGGAVTDLLTDLGLADRVVAPEPTGTWVYRPEATTRIPDGAVLGIPVALEDPALAALGTDAVERARQDLTLPPTVGRDAQTLGALVRTRMGDTIADTWLRPLVAGVHRLDIDAIGPELLLPGLLDRMSEAGSLSAALRGGGGQLAGLDGGLTQLVDALAGELTSRGAIIVRAAATAVEPDLQGWRVRTSHGTVIHADRLVLACPPWTWPSGLPGAVAEQARAWPRPHPVDLLTLVLPADPAARQSGAIVADGGGTVQARALTFSSAKWAWVAQQAGGRAVLRLTYDATEASDDVLSAQALADAAALTGGSWAPGDEHAYDRTRWQMARSAVEPDMAEHRTAMRAVLADAGITATGGWLAGTGLAWTVADARAAVSSW